MSRKREIAGPTDRVAAKPATASPAVVRARRRLLIVGAMFLLAMVLTAGVWADWYYGLPADAEATYVGGQTCATCHQAEHEKWQGSHHDLAMDLATDATVLGDFKDVTLTHHGVTSKLFRRDGKFFVNTEGPDGQMTDFEIKYVFGVDPLQQYMVEFDRTPDMPPSEVARLQVLRISWDTQKKKWFHLDPPDVKEKLDPTDELHWTGLAQRWNHMCADCHSTNLKKNYDVATARYHTTFSEIDVSCEACHGPGSLHVQLARSPSLFWDRERGYALAKLKVPSNIPQVQACAPCHSRRRVVAPSYAGGCNYYDYYSNEVLAADAYHADGQILDEVYEYSSFVQSKMYHKGIKCSDCHDPHSARLKHTGNQVCTSCHQHPAGKFDGENHHRHPMSSTGASCVECHMPQTTYMDVDPRRDHSFRIPRPDLSVKLGTPNACSRCHIKDQRLPGSQGSPDAAVLKDLLARPELKEYAGWLAAARQGDRAVKARVAEVDQWADATLDKWYGANRKREPHFAEALHSAHQMSADAPAKLVELLGNKTQPAVARATAALELGAHVEVGNAAHLALQKALGDPDPSVRAAAIMSLPQDGSDATLSLLAPLLSSKEPRLVRTEAARALVRMDPSRFTGEERVAFRAAIEECIVGAMTANDRAASHLNVASMYEGLGDLKGAEEAYQTALRIEPRSVGTRANLAYLYDNMLQSAQQQAMQRAQQGDRAGAEQIIGTVAHLPEIVHRLRAEELSLQERDVLLAPQIAAVQSRTGLIRYSVGWRKEAENALLTASLLEPRNPLFLYHLATLYRDTGRIEQAKPLAEKLLKLQPQNAVFQQFAAQLAQPAGPALPQGP